MPLLFGTPGNREPPDAIAFRRVNPVRRGIVAGRSPLPRIPLDFETVPAKRKPHIFRSPTFFGARIESVQCRLRRTNSLALGSLWGRVTWTSARGGEPTSLAA